MTTIVTAKNITNATNDSGDDDNNLHKRHHKLAGNIINSFVLVMSVLYVCTVAYFTLPGAHGVLDEHWKKDGFCIQNVDVPYWSSFDTCLYIDIILSIILGTLYFAWKDIPGMGRSSETVPALIMATLGHGFAHGAMAIKLRDGSYHQLMDGNSDTVEEHPVPATWQLLCFGAIFWFPLLKGVLPKMNIKHVAILSAVATYGQCFVKKELSFSYVQTIVNIAFHISQLTLPLDDKICREYMMMPLANVLPIIVAWNEILFCDSFFRSAGGHLLYDASIPVSFIIFYLDCYLHNTKRNTNSLAKEKLA